MSYYDEVSRRVFLERLTAGALLGAAGAFTKPARADAGSNPWTPPPALKNPNILIVMVDQMRPPMWMTPAQQSQLSQTVLPNIMGRIHDNGYSFEQAFVAATICTASRAALLTGLYAPQTAMYVTGGPGAGTPALNPAFPTWGRALPALNPAYNNNVWWFGKWHLSDVLSSTPLAQYGFRTRTYPGGITAPFNHSPDGVANEGSSGAQQWANDSMIATDFVQWLQGQGGSSAPWCATVSFVNPHDITFAPAWLQNSPFPPTNVPPQGVYFPPPSGNPPSFYPAVPTPWNNEVPSQVPNKPKLQVNYTAANNAQSGTVTDWSVYLNQYYWLQNLVDQQVGKVLDALGNSPFSNNTIVLFLSDHGEYAGSHGMRTKGYAVYDESMRIPFYVRFPGQTGSTSMNQMCSAVDLFGMICDLGTGGSAQWRLAYPDLANRQSLWSFLYNNSRETRVAPAPVGLPYVLHTFDQGISIQNQGKCHVVCMRTKLDLNAGAVGAKLAFYSEWAPCTTYPDATAPDPEFYDYNPQTTNNTSETGNDYFVNNATTQNTIAQYTQVLGSLTPPVPGLCGSELNPPLLGLGNDGNPLSQAQAAAQQAYYAYLGASGCQGV